MNNIPLKRDQVVVPVPGLEYFGREATVRSLAARHFMPELDEGSTTDVVDRDDRLVVQIRIGDWSHLMGVALYDIVKNTKQEDDSIKRESTGVQGYSTQWNHFSHKSLVGISYLRVITLPKAAHDYPCALPGGRILPSFTWLVEQLEELLDSSVPLVGPLATIAAQLGYETDPTSLLLSYGLLPGIDASSERAVPAERLAQAAVPACGQSQPTPLGGLPLDTAAIAFTGQASPSIEPLGQSIDPGEAGLGSFGTGLGSGYGSLGRV